MKLPCHMLRFSSTGRKSLHAHGSYRAVGQQFTSPFYVFFSLTLAMAPRLEGAVVAPRWTATEDTADPISQSGTGEPGIDAADGAGLPLFRSGRTSCAEV